MVDNTRSGRLSGLLSRDRIVQFIAVGTVGAAVDISLLTLFHGILGFDLLASKLTSAEISFVVMFAINEHWTFSDFGRTTVRATVKRFLRSNSVRIGGLLTATGVLVFLTSTTGMWYLLANVIGIGVGFFVNYSFESLFTWRTHDSVPGDSRENPENSF